ncbi:MAG: FAD-dependent oxidoreductase [Planctomycetaceae bacterium]|jgi:hypothetical protein|nr:FAD-dependent oxidoreductase [Planctomycetaceae bacterium]
MKTFNLFLSILLLFVFSSTIFATEPIPENGLVLHLDAGQSVETDAEGHVVCWNDLSPNKRTAIVPKGRSAPRHDSLNRSIQFQNGTGLYIDEQVVPADQRNVSVFAVAESVGSSSFSIIGLRTGAVPLVQLDVDNNEMARWIVRDTKNQTISAETPAVSGTKTLFGGIIKDTENGTAMSVFYHDQEETVNGSRLNSPLFVKGMFIGCLGMPQYSWTGTISEILIYDRALSADETDQIKKYLFEKHQIQKIVSTYQDSWNVLNIPRYTGQVDQEFSTDVCVVGAGSAGCAAAIIAAREGANVVLVERQEQLGGTGTNAGVSNWEPGPGCSLARELFERMKALGGAGVGSPQPLQTKAAYGYFPVTDGESYESTTHRANVVPAQFRDVLYKPEIFDQVVRKMLFETKRVVLLDKTYFFQSETNSEKTRIESILVRNTEEKTIRIRAKVFIDSTGDVWVCRSIGCETMLGIDPQNAFNEPSAPEKGHLQLNAITRTYTIARYSETKTQPVPNPSVPFPACAFICGWKNGLLSVNMLPTLPGKSLIDYGYDEALRRSEQIVYAHWHWLQQIPDFQDFELIQIAPMLGIRESYRVKTKYVLREQDLIETLKNQQHNDIIAIADHACDIHGAGGGLKPVSFAYGIPYRCMIPAGNWQNVLVACRGAGFSRIAASSCRLQRTMIQLGHAAGLAAAWAVEKNNSVEKIDVPALVKRLNAPKRYNEYLPPKKL